MISKKQIEHLARLSRIIIRLEEIELLQKQVDDILSFVATLQKVDTTDIKPEFYLNKKTNARIDEVRFSLNRDDIISAMPEKKDGLLKTPKIFS